VGQISLGPGIFRPRMWLEAALDLLFPPHCVGCASPGPVWCASCASRLQTLDGPVCALCGRPEERDDGVCQTCSQSPPILVSRSFAWYQPPLDGAILYLKYRPDRRLADVMGGWLADVMHRSGWQADLITSVPLSRRRRAQRGYNQADLLGKALARGTGLPMRSSALTRRRETGTQVGLGPRERMRNVAGAFEASSGLVRHKAVIVVDDLFTTGATLDACAAGLIDAGASRVYGLTVARAGHTVPRANPHGG
jgi:ComF family protein